MTVILMCTYFYIGKEKNEVYKEISLEQFADSNYYLGFIFTLSSLSISLINISTNDANTMEILIIQFGIALITTLLGLIFRIFLINFSPSEETNKEIFHLMISEKIKLIDDQLIQSIDKNKIFSDTLEEKILIFQEQLTLQLKSFNKSMTENLDLKIFEEIIDNIVKGLNNAYNNQNKSLNNIVDNIKKNHERYIESTDLFKDNILQNNVLIETMGAKLKDYTYDLGSNNKQYNKSIDDFNNLIEKLINKSNEDNKQLTDELFKNFKMLFNINEAHNKNISTSINNNNENKKLTKELLDTFKAYVEVNSRYNKKLNATIENNLENTSDLIKMNNKLDVNINKIENSVNKQFSYLNNDIFKVKTILEKTIKTKENIVEIPKEKTSEEDIIEIQKEKTSEEDIIEIKPSFINKFFGQN